MVNGELPLHSRLDLASLPSAVGRGRTHLRRSLAGWGVPRGVTEDAELIASELLANAVQHAATLLDGSPRASRCTLLLWLTGMGLTVAVYDEDRRPPVPRVASSSSERGRGLLLVESLSEIWGHNYPSADSGKIVWARLFLPLPESCPGGQRVLSDTLCPEATWSPKVAIA